MLDIGRQIGLAKHIGVRLVADLASGAKDADEPLSQHRADGVSDHLRRQTEVNQSQESRHGVRSLDRSQD